MQKYRILFLATVAAVFGLVTPEIGRTGILVRPVWLDFYNTPINSCQENRREIEILNTGKEDVRLRFDCRNDFIGPSFRTSFFYENRECRNALRPGQRCRITVYFRGEEQGFYWGRFEVESRDGQHRESVDLRAQISDSGGSGFPSPKCDFVERCF